MTKVTIEQTDGGWQTYIRLHGLGHALADPSFRISRSGSAESLGPNGWMNNAVVNDAMQYLEGEDLLLEIGKELINYLDPGLPIEVHVPELKLVERLLVPDLSSVSHSAAGEVPKAERIPFSRTSPPRMAPAVPGPPTALTTPPSPPISPPVPPQTPPTRPPTTGGFTGPPPTGEPAPRRAGPQLWGMVAAALVIGIVIGAAIRHFADPWLRPQAPAQQTADGEQERKLLLSEAYGPLSADARRIADHSPAGVAPDDVATRLQLDRSRAFYTRGNLSPNKTEAVYWYKQAVHSCEAEAFTMLGDAYFNGDGVPRDRRTGFQLLRCAGALGSTQADTYLGKLLNAGNVPHVPPEIGHELATQYLHAPQR